MWTCGEKKKFVKLTRYLYGRGTARQADFAAANLGRVGSALNVTSGRRYMCRPWRGHSICVGSDQKLASIVIGSLEVSPLIVEWFTILTIEFSARKQTGPSSESKA